MNKLTVILVLCLLGSIANISAQSFYNHRMGRDMIVSFGTGTSTYFGDLKDPKKYMDAKPTINVGLQYALHPHVSARAEVNWFRLSGDDSDSNTGRSIRNLSFRSDNFEVNLIGIVNLFPKGRRFYQRPQFNPYGFAGLGLLYFNPKGEVPETDWDDNPLPDAGKYISLQPLKTEGVNYSRMAVVLPFGFGVKCKLNPFFDLALEGGYRLTFTDYLDDVSTVYLDHNSFGDDKLAQVMADKRHALDGELPPAAAGNVRGYPRKNDGYFLLSVKLEYFIPNNLMGAKKRKPKRYKRRR